MEPQKRSLKTIAQAGLISKGIVYVLIGVLAFMAAFELGGQSNKDGGKEGAFQTLLNLPAGRILLGAVAVGLLCYAVWRFIQAFHPKKEEAQGAKKWGYGLRYILSGAAYLVLAFAAAKIAFYNRSGGSNNNMASTILSKSYGSVLLIIVAIILAGIGVYQLWYAYSEKYKKHIQAGAVNSNAASLIINAGKWGYAARGIVWLLIAWLLIKAALTNNASEAGETTGAFQFLEEASYGSYLLGALGVGLALYGIFNFIRARYERFD